MRNRAPGIPGGSVALKRGLMVLLTGLVGGCVLPSLDGRSESRALTAVESAATRLGIGLAAQLEAHPAQTGLLALQDARGAFAARVLLARAAQRTLDVQYYIWRRDVTGLLLLQSLYQAAERGVRVRLLLDDNGTAGLDDLLALLDAHPLIEVRLFNPFVIRSPKAISYLTDFSRANRRMHNKSFTADSQATIVGGRNVGDEYFGATEGILFADLDVLAVGAVVPEVSTDFDRYWASDSAYPLDGLLPVRAPQELPAFVEAAAQAERNPEATQYLKALRDSELVSDMAAGRLSLHWSRATLISDDPRKGLGLASDAELLVPRLRRIVGQARTHVDLVSPYFVPTAAGVEAFAALAAGGVRVRILTNALEATDVVAVHAGYAKRRKALLEAGIQLHEMRSRNGDTPDARAGPFGSSGSSLHAKTFSVDGKRVFVGSFNFDPRSARLNTELGVVIDTEALARQIEAAFDARMPAGSYEVRLDEHGRLYWLQREAGGSQVRHDGEPGAGLLKRLGIGVLALLPIEWLL